MGGRKLQAGDGVRHVLRIHSNAGGTLKAVEPNTHRKRLPWRTVTWVCDDRVELGLKLETEMKTISRHPSKWRHREETIWGTESQRDRAAGVKISGCSSRYLPLRHSSRCSMPCFETFASVISSGIQSGLSSGAVSCQAQPS